MRWSSPVAAQIFGLIVMAIACAPSALARQGISTDPPECEIASKPAIKTFKTPVFRDQAHDVRALGRVSLRVTSIDEKHKYCHAVYQLFVSFGEKPFVRVQRVEAEISVGFGAGIDLVGLSPDGNYFAADLWEAAGDWVGHRPAISNLITQKSVYRSLDDVIQKQITGCDQLEDFIGVTNTGEAIFAVPPSIYDDSPGCGDKGLWYFNLSTGKAHRVRKNSGVKWR